MIGIIGKKLGMTQLFNEQGQQIPCTVVEAPPNTVTKVTDKAKAGFASVTDRVGNGKTLLGVLERQSDVSVGLR